MDEEEEEEAILAINKCLILIDILKVDDLTLWFFNWKKYHQTQLLQLFYFFIYCSSLSFVICKRPLIVKFSDWSCRSFFLLFVIKTTA